MIVDPDSALAYPLTRHSVIVVGTAEWNPGEGEEKVTCDKFDCSLFFPSLVIVTNAFRI